MTPEQFRAHREALGLTQKQAGALFHCDPRQIIRWEQRGPTPLAADYMRAVVAGFIPTVDETEIEVHNS
jgi:DNA-binding transcriptional regulator YiaG